MRLLWGEASRSAVGPARQRIYVAFRASGPVAEPGDVGGRGANTMSWAGIYNTFFWIDREKKVCAVIMSQMSPGTDSGPLKMIEDFDRAVYA